jgi:vacuolar protein sorting-associated protein 13A/C
LKKYIKETFEAIADKIKESKKEDGMLDKLGKKIIDNLKMQIKNIHIRFEEANQEHIYSFGLALKSLTFGTTDKNWNPIYIER